MPRKRVTRSTVKKPASEVKYTLFDIRRRPKDKKDQQARTLRGIRTKTTRRKRRGGSSA